MSKLAKIIRARCTDKVLADAAAPLAPAGLTREAVDAMLETAGCAPFHYPATAAHRQGEMDSVVPYRVYKLDAPSCRSLSERIHAAGLKAGKILPMLAAAEALLLVAWLPEEGARGADEAFAGTEINMENIAAGSAAIQNLLLLATEAGLRSYWSSGGVLRGQPLYDWLAIPPEQMLLGAVFLFPAEVGDAEVAPGKMRDKRGALSGWSAWREVE